MAIKQFAIPQDENSDEQGEIDFKTLANAGASAEFKLINVSSGGSTDKLNLITKKGGSQTDHMFSVTVVSGIAHVILTSAQLSTVYNDSVNGDWDYVEAKWAVGAVDFPNKSEFYQIQNGRTYDMTKWPPNS